MLKKGDILDGRYIIDELIGSGGTSSVYRAFDLDADRSERAVKEIHGSDEEIEEKIAESGLMAELSRNNTKYNFIPNIIHRVRKGDALFIVMDYINGTDMTGMIDQSFTADTAKIIEYSKDICTFMSFMHEKHYIFSDMKPDNIMILKNDDSASKIEESKQYSSLKFVDFGAAVSEGSETIAFTPSYAAPEQFLGQFDTVLPDRRTDIFNIGATMYHMVTGHAPENVFRGNGNQKTDLRPSSERFIFPPKSSISAGLRRIILKCVADDKNNRYSECSEIISDLEKVSARKYILTSGILLGLSLILALSGTLTLLKYNSEKINIYQDCIEAADISVSAEEKIQNCVTAIKLLPEKQEGYIKLMDACTFSSNASENNEMYFTSAEKKTVQELLASNRNILTENGDYALIEFELGKLIWYFSSEDKDIKSYPESEKSKMKSSISYFEEAVNAENSTLSPEETRLAGIYYHVADFCTNYQKRIENGDRNDPVSLSDLKYLTESVRKNESSNYIRLTTYYAVLETLNESRDYYENESDDDMLDFYILIYQYTQECSESDLPAADKNLKETVSELCNNMIFDF